MNVLIEVSERQVRQLIVDYLERQLGELAVDVDKVCIEVKSKQNWKAEWEKADFRAVYKNESI